MRRGSAQKALIVDKPLVCQRGLPGRLSTHRPALTLARRSVAAHRPRLRRGCVPPLRTSLRSVSSGLQPLRGLWLRTALRSVCSPLQPFGPSTDSDRDGNAFLPTVRNRRSTSHAKRACGSCCSLGLLRPVSATGGGLRAHPQFAMVVLLRLTACSTPLLIGLTSACFAHSARPSCAPQKMPEMTYTPSFLIRASFFRYFVNTLCQRS